MLEFDTTPSPFRDQLTVEPFDIAAQVEASGGYAVAPEAPGIGVEPDPDFIEKHRVE